MENEKTMILIFNQLSRDSQKYLLTLANMAFIAEKGKEKEVIKNNKSKTA